MKTLVLILIATFSLNAFADQPMTEKEQQEYITYTAKEIRKSYWRSQYEDVESRTSKFDRKMLDEYVTSERQNRYDNPLAQVPPRGGQL